MFKIHCISWDQLQHHLSFWKVPNVIIVTLIISCSFKRKMWEQIFLFFCCVKPWGEIFSTNYLSQWTLCWHFTNVVCQPSHRAAVEDLVYYLRDERRCVSFCLVLFCLWWFYFAVHLLRWFRNPQETILFFTSSHSLNMEVIVVVTMWVCSCMWVHC